MRRAAALGGTLGTAVVVNTVGPSGVAAAQTSSVSSAIAHQAGQTLDRKYVAGSCAEPWPVDLFQCGF